MQPWTLFGMVGLVGAVAVAAALPPAVQPPVRVEAVTAPHGRPELAVDASRAVARIDELVTAGWKADQVRPNPLLSDEAFCRRAYLTILGRNPTWQEAVAFATATAPAKRRKLVEALVDQPGRVSHQFHFLADLLRVQTRLQDRSPGQPYIAWVKDALRENRPWDQMVKQLLTAKGPALERGNGATGFWLRDAGMPLDHMATTVQAFLGTQVGCAQCHDHPFDRWKRQEFYQMAAFTSGVNLVRKLPGGVSEKEMRKKISEDDLTPALRNAFRRLRDTIGSSVTANDRSSLTLPPDWQYPDRGKPGQQVHAHAIFDGPTVAKGSDPRAVLADWITGPDNPRFAVVMANRLWKQVFGQGVVEPVDGFTDNTRATDPELLTWIGLVFQGTGYDIKAFTRILCSTDLFQREVTPKTIGELAGEPYRFPGPVLRRMTAEQTWDSLMTLLVNDLDAKVGEGAEPQWLAYEANKDRTPEQILELAKEMASARTGMEALREKAEDIRRELAKAGNGPEAAKLREQLEALARQREALENNRKHLAALGKNADRRNAAGNGAWMRAAELPSPAPPGHLLRLFGQSDREAPLGSTDAASVTQALALMNSLVDSEILKPKSVLAKAIADQPQLADKARVLFLAILGRQPTPPELRTLGVEMAMAPPKAGGGEAAAADEVLKDLAWVLINSHEFRFIP